MTPPYYMPDDICENLIILRLMKETTIAPQDDDIRLDRWFARHFPGVTQGELQKLLRKKLVRVDGKRVETNSRIKAGQLIRHPEFDDATTPRPKPQPRAADTAWLKEAILFENKHCIIINKPSGLATQGGTGQSTHMDALLPALQGHYPEAPRLVHRLDKDTSGVLVIARSAKAADILMKQFADKSTEKTYWALVAGVPVPQEGLIDAPIGKLRTGGGDRMGIDPEGGKRALTEYRVIEPLARRFAWVELKPLTGRTHQLRVHMAEMECQIIGDRKYGGNRAFPEGMNLPKKLHLHARHIIIPDLFGEMIEATAPLPPHMQQSWEILGLTV